MSAGAPGSAPAGSPGRTLHALSRALAVAGGMVLLAVAGLVVASVLARTVLGRPIPGDFELVAMGTAIAAFAFLPYCQMTGGNVAVDFALARAPAALRRALAVAANGLYTLIAALLAWRLALGALDLRRSGEVTLVLGLPEWWALVPMVPALALLAVVCAWCTWRSLAGPHG